MIYITTFNIYIRGEIHMSVCIYIYIYTYIYIYIKLLVCIYIFACKTYILTFFLTHKPLFRLKHQSIQLKIFTFLSSHAASSGPVSQSSQEKICYKGFWKYFYFPNKRDLLTLLFASFALLRPRMQI